MTDKAKIWERLEKQAEALPRLADLFSSDPNRAKRFSYDVGGLYADFSKQKIDADIFQNLLELAQACGLENWRGKFFAGDPINTSENRAVLHPALRGTGGSAQVQKQVADMRARTRGFAEKLRADKKIKTIIHIGIGGSDLGPRLCADALAASAKPEFELRFAENVDGASINDALAGLDPKSTLVISVSKSFTTQETRMNTEAARDWLGKHAGANMVAVTANKTRRNRILALRQPIKFSSFGIGLADGFLCGQR